MGILVLFSLFTFSSSPRNWNGKAGPRVYLENTEIINGNDLGNEELNTMPKVATVELTLG